MEEENYDTENVPLLLDSLDKRMDEVCRVLSDRRRGEKQKIGDLKSNLKRFAHL